MKVFIDFDVHATTLDDAVTDAAAKLAAFAPDVPAEAWQIVLHCSPSVSAINGDNNLWHIQVEAGR